MHMTKPKPAVSYDLYKLYLQVKRKYHYTRRSPMLETLAGLFAQDDDLAKKAYEELKKGKFDKDSEAGEDIKFDLVRNQAVSYCPSRYANKAIQNVQNGFGSFRADLEEICALEVCSKTDINDFVESAISLALILQKRTLQIPYMSYWGLEKPKFWLGITSPGLGEFVYAWAKLMLKATD
jgi:hypothetical protein